MHVAVAVSRKRKDERHERPETRVMIDWIPNAEGSFHRDLSTRGIES